MKRIVYITLFIIPIFFGSSCNSEGANDCFQADGDIIRELRSVGPFSKILVKEGVEMIIMEGLDYEIEVESGENLMNDIKVEVINGQLILTDDNSCNYFRDYNITKIYVTAPNITEIRSSTQFDIKSSGVLRFSRLKIISEDFNFPSSQTVGDFYLEISSESFGVQFNNLSNCYVSGSVNNLNVQYFSGNGRFEGENLIATNVDIYHRGSNDIITHPIESLTGGLYGTGDLISVNNPETVDVIEHYQGRLIFRN